MLLEGQGFVDMDTEVLDAMAGGYWLVVDNEGRVQGEVICLVFAVSG
jgi:hypothetical protein